MHELVPRPSFAKPTKFRSCGLPCLPLPLRSPRLQPACEYRSMLQHRPELEVVNDARPAEAAGAIFIDPDDAGPGVRLKQSRAKR